MKAVFFIIAVAAFAQTAFAQQAGGSFKRLPSPASFSRWTIEYKLPGKSGEEPNKDLEHQPSVLKREYTLTGDTGAIEEWHADGTKVEIFQAGNWQLLKPKGSKHIVVLDLTDLLAPEQAIGHTFPGVGWVRPEKLSDVVEAYGETCLYFKDTVASTKEDGGSTPVITREAWVSQKSGFPVAYRVNGVEGRFSFQSAPSEKIQLPAEYATFLSQRIHSGPPPGQAASLLKE